MKGFNSSIFDVPEIKVTFRLNISITLLVLKECQIYVQKDYKILGNICNIILKLIWCIIMTEFLVMIKSSMELIL